MKKIKILVALMLFCAMGYTGYTVHEKMTTSEAERFLHVNVEALTLGEGGTYEYPDGYAYFSKCGVKISKFSKCQVETITCLGGGSGCNSKKCPVHK